MAPARKKQNRPEEQVQQAIATFLDTALHRDARWWHTPNQKGTRSTYEQKILSSLGVKAGVPDVVIVWQSRIHFIEVKSPDVKPMGALKGKRGGSLSKTQKPWKEWAETTGTPWSLARSIDDVEVALVRWGIPHRASTGRKRIDGEAAVAADKTTGTTISAAQLLTHAEPDDVRAAAVAMATVVNIEAQSARRSPGQSAVMKALSIALRAMSRELAQ